MKVAVYFAKEHVANVAVIDTNCVEDALEQAWRRIQNVGGSWSRGPEFKDGTPNYDYHPSIEVIKPLEEHDGHIYGHRSAMVGDRFVVNDLSYEVAICGFEKVQ